MATTRRAWSRWSASASTPTVNWARVPGLQTLHLKTIGIAGFGEIGANLALMLKPFNCRVLYNKRTPLSAAQEAYYGVQYASLDEVLEDGDVVVQPAADHRRDARRAGRAAVRADEGRRRSSSTRAAA